jgi:hypothetical protein
VEDLQTVTGMLPDIEDGIMKGSLGEEDSVALDLTELDKACEDVALMIQYIESYEGFVKHCVEEIHRAKEYREEKEGEGGEVEEVLPKVTQVRLGGGREGGGDC